MATPLASSVEIYPDTRGAQIIEDEASPDQRDSRDIYLPNHQERVSHIAIDVGGSLAKVVYFARARSNSETRNDIKETLPKPSASTSSTTDNSKKSEVSNSKPTEPSSPHSSSSPPLFGADLSSSFYSHYSDPPSSSLDDASSPNSNTSTRNRTRTASSENNGPPTPSGTLTPTAILHSSTSSLTNNYQPHSPTFSPNSKGKGKGDPFSIDANNKKNLSSISSSIHSTLLRRRSLPSQLPGGRLYFLKFETSDIQNCISFLSTLISNSAKSNGVSISEMKKSVNLIATGGGAHLFYELFEKELDIVVQKEDEMKCLITGLNFFTLIPDEVFWYSDELVSKLHDHLPSKKNREGSADGSDLEGVKTEKASPIPNLQNQGPDSLPIPTPSQDLPRPSPSPPLYNPLFDSHPSPKLPCLLVNIGSGVSIIKVDDYGKFERVSGTSLGGGTLWGLLSLLTEADSFDEMLSLSESGDNSNVDMLVGDIYGAIGLNHLGLKSSTIASSFGKVFKKNGPRNINDRKKKFKSQDICRSLLYAVSNNIGQIAYMNAEKYNLDRIYFGGCFIRGHKSTISTLSYAIRFWSRGTKRAFFLRHEGYLGAIGAWLRHVGVDSSNDPASPTEATPAANSNSRAQESNTQSASPSHSPSSSFSASRASKVSQNSTSIPTPRVQTNHQLPSLLQEALGDSTLDGFGSSQSKSTTSSIPIPRNGINGQVDGITSQSQDSKEESGKEERNLSDVLKSLSPQDLKLLSPYLPPEVLPSTLNFNSREEQISPKSPAATLEERVEDKTVDADEEVDGDLEIDPNQMIQLDGGETFSLKDLLSKMDMAEGAADGLEDKLDTLLGKLDGMLQGLGVDDE